MVGEKKFKRSRKKGKKSRSSIYLRGITFQ